VYLTADKVVNGLICAQKVLKDPRVWNGRPDFLPVSVDAARVVIEELSGYKVTMRSVSFDAKHVFARVEKYKDKTATVDVRHNLSEDWKRFVAAKELLHLIIDKDEDMSPYGDETLDKLVRDGHIGIISQNGDKPPAQSELIAEVAAMELLYPIQNRPSDLGDVKAEKSSFAKLSIRYGIPPNFIDTVFSEGYRETLMAAFTQTQGK
jgi:Zn-dependent peptidase ImmA (M78 family)